jgi:hypothetical protein
MHPQAPPSHSTGFPAPPLILSSSSSFFLSHWFSCSASRHSFSSSFTSFIGFPAPTRILSYSSSSFPNSLVFLLCSSSFLSPPPFLNSLVFLLCSSLFFLLHIYLIHWFSTTHPFFLLLILFLIHWFS